MMSILLAGALTFTPLYGTCGPDVHPATIQAIVEVESAEKPYAIHDGATQTAIFPKSKDEAVRIAKSLLAKGHSLDVGLMQINTAHLPELKRRGIGVEDLFDPCTNIQTGTRILSDFYKFHARKNPKDQPDVTLLKAISAYNTGGPFEGKEYVRKILKRAGKARYCWPQQIAGNHQYKVYYPFYSNVKKSKVFISYRNVTFFKKEKQNE